MRMRTMLPRLRARSAPVLGLVMIAATAGCVDLFVPDHNNPGLEEVETNPTPAAVRTLATGLLVGARQDLTDRTSYTAQLGIIGREAYILDGSDPRYISELLVGPLSNSGAFGGGLWTLRYQNIRNANILLNAVEQLSDDPVAGIPAADKEGIRGFAKTMQALDFLLVINTRHLNGAPIDVDGPVGADPAPLANRAAVFARIVSLLDEGNAHLQASGSTFAFPLSPGFAGFDSPATFRQFNRALKARVDAYLGNYTQALTDLSASFVSTGAPLTLGAYHYYGTASGDAQNLLATNTSIYAHPSIVADAQLQPGGAPDLRLSKVAVTDPKTVSGITSNLKFTIYPLATSPIPVIRNEELILLRAEARWFTGDKPGAMADLNFIRTTAGGLAAMAAPASDAEFVTALLRERRYSLLFEGGHRWIDARRFNRLGELPHDSPTHTVHASYAIPEAECLARNLPATCSAS
jgi:starch-binding outer membrane protein, SusD/RagB family